jgi:electron transfer flavoprotein alpha subunit
MSTILVIAEQRGGALRKTAHEALSQARRMADADAGGRVVAMIAGSGIIGLAAMAARFGADHVYLADHADLAAYSTEGYALAAQRAFEMSGADLVLVGGSAMGRDLAPRLAARLKLAYLADVVELAGTGTSLTAVRPMFAGKVRTHRIPRDLKQQ